MFAFLAPSALPASAVSHVHGKTTDSAAGSQFGNFLSEQSSLLDAAPASLPAWRPIPVETSETANASGANVVTSQAKPPEPAPLPLVTQKDNGPTNTSNGKDKKSAPPRKATNAAPSDTVVATTALPVPLIQKLPFALDFNVPQPIQTNVSDETSHDKTDAAGSASKPVQGHAAHQDESTAAAMPFEAESVPETGGSAEANNLTPVPHKPQVSKSNAGEDSPSSELAFASRIQEQSKTNPTQTSKDSTSGQSSAEQPEPAAASASPRTGAKTPSASEEERQPVPVKPDAAVNTQTVSQAYSSRTDFQPAPPQAQPTPAASRVETPVPPAEAKSAAPLKDVTFQVTQESAKVEVRIVQEAGDVRVAVRSGDTDLVHGLRQDLSDLSGKLQQSGYSAETWRPGAVTESTGSNNDTRKDTGDSGNGQPQSQSGGSHQDRGQQQQHRFNRPQWLDEMESTSNTQVHTIGVSNGFDS